MLTIENGGKDVALLRPGRFPVAAPELPGGAAAAPPVPPLPLLIACSNCACWAARAAARFESICGVLMNAGGIAAGAGGGAAPEGPTTMPVKSAWILACGVTQRR